MLDQPYLQRWWQQALPSLERRPNALLMLGPKSIGKTEFALEVIAALLCTAPRLEDRSPCGTCQSCNWMATRQHPDFRWVRPDANADELEAQEDVSGTEGATSESTASGESKKKSQEIRIEQIRSLAGFANIGAHRGGLRVILISPANRMNYAAANALLKTLEEPTAGLMFILVADSLRGIPATVLSRCRRLHLDLNQYDLAALQAKPREVAQWLLPLLTSGPIDPVRWADVAGKSPPGDVIDFLMRWMVDAARIRLELSAVSFPQQIDALSRLAQNIRSPQGWSEALADLQRARGAADHPLNPKLFYETIFDRYRRAL